MLVEATIIDYELSISKFLFKNSHNLCKKFNSLLKAIIVTKTKAR